MGPRDFFLAWLPTRSAGRRMPPLAPSRSSLAAPNAAAGVGRLGVYFGKLSLCAFVVKYLSRFPFADYGKEENASAMESGSRTQLTIRAAF